MTCRRGNASFRRRMPNNNGKGKAMSTDRELLELAAKAAGYWNYTYNCYEGPVSWNPLTNDGDALRLAVKLKMDIRPSEETQTIHIWSDVLDQWIGEFYGGTNDSYAATRRAIVRAAASMERKE